MRTIILTTDKLKNLSIRSVSADAAVEETAIESIDFAVGVTADLEEVAAQDRLCIYYIHPLYVAEAAILSGLDVHKAQTFMRLLLAEITDFYRSSRSNIELRAVDLENMDEQVSNSTLKGAATRLVASQLLSNDKHIAKKLSELEACSVSGFEHSPSLPIAELLLSLSETERVLLENTQQIEAAKDKVIKLEDQLVNETKYRAKAEELVNSLQDEFDTINDELNRLKLELESQSNTVKAEVKLKEEVEAENRDLLEQLFKTQEAYETLLEKQRDVEKLNEKTTADLVEATNRAKSLEAELNKATLSNESALDQIASVKNELQKTLSALDTESQKLISAEKSNAELESENEQILGELFKVQESYEQLLEQNTLKQKELARSYTNISDLRSQKIKDEVYLSWLTSTIEQLHRESFAHNRRFKRAMTRNRKLIEQFSQIFDPSYYTENYPDALNSEWKPLEHFLLFGCYEGKNPSAGFDTHAYLTEYPDVAESGFNPLIHYIKFGQFEGRNPSPEIKKLTHVK